MPRALVDGVGLHYERRPGAGPELVLVHGLAANLSFWFLRLVPLLPRELSITLYDLRGHGQSDMPPRGYTTADMAADLHGLLDHLGVRRAHLVGHSYGGAVALHYATLHPERVASLTIADARIRALQPTQRLVDWPNAAMWRKVLHDLGVGGALDDPEMGSRLLEALAEARLRGVEPNRAAFGLFSPFGLSRSSRRSAERWLQLLRSTSARSDFAALAGLTPERIASLRRPVLCVFGEQSNCLPSCRGLQRHLPSCRVAIVPRVGHFHPISRPAVFAQHLRAFLAEVA